MVGCACGLFGDNADANDAEASAVRARQARQVVKARRLRLRSDLIPTLTDAPREFHVIAGLLRRRWDRTIQVLLISVDVAAILLADHRRDEQADHRQQNRAPKPSLLEKSHPEREARTLV